VGVEVRRAKIIAADMDDDKIAAPLDGLVELEQDSFVAVDGRASSAEEVDTDVGDPESIRALLVKVVFQAPTMATRMVTNGAV
jgi:hypothetical protein